MKNNALKGFTLLEMLVVLGIISIMISFLSVVYSRAQKSSRDARRRQDIVAIQNALEQYYAANDYTYPDCSSGATCDALLPYFSGGTVIPTDPLATKAYSIVSSSATNTYTVSATLDIDNSTISVTQLQ